MGIGRAQEEEGNISGYTTLLTKLRKDIDNAEGELEEKGGIVQGFDGSRTERHTWAKLYNCSMTPYYTTRVV